MTDRELMQQALEALEQYTDVVASGNEPDTWITVVDAGKPARDAITALRERLAQPQQWEQLYPDIGNPFKRPATREEKIVRPGVYEVTGPLHVVCQCDKCKAQPEQEPVAWMQEMPTKGDETRSARLTTVEALAREEWSNPISLYTTPPRRDWVGLTEAERDSFWRADQMTGEEWRELFDAIEAKLKEKNA